MPCLSAYSLKNIPAGGSPRLASIFTIYGGTQIPSNDPKTNKIARVRVSARCVDNGRAADGLGFDLRFSGSNANPGV